MENIASSILFVVRALPYEAGGTPVVIRNLLKYLPQKNIYVLGRRVNPKKRIGIEEVRQKMFKIPILYTFGHRFWKYFSILPGFIMGTYIIKKYKINKIVGVFQDDGSLILAYLLCIFNKKISFYPYFMDLYAEQRTGISARISAYIQNRIFKRADKILLINEGMRDFQIKNYSGLEFATVPIISQNIENEELFIGGQNKEKFVVVFSGSVNEDRIETLKVFTQIIAKDSRFTFKYLTGQSEQDLRELGVFYDGFELQYCKTQQELFSQLSRADILYLPLRFSYPKFMEAQMITCFGAKVFDYMQVSVPILIHSPSNLFNYTYLEDNNAAFLLNTLDLSAIELFLESVFSEDYQIKAGEKYKNAKRLSETFDGHNISSIFLEQISYQNSSS